MPENKVGKEMAERVAQRLKMKCDLAYDHRDYCGTGLTWRNGKFIYGGVYDGLVGSTVIKEFGNEREFVEWLAEQTDYSLSGADEDQFYKNNQRITLTRLFSFVSSKPTPRFEN